MKLLAEDTKSVSRGITQTVEFGIANSPKMFKILSDGLYSDKIRAVIRELSTNAVDAHIAAGTLYKPYLVHLPTRLEPYFSIRDFGTGLSDEDMQVLYTTYGASNKSGSNDYIGCMGLGSKSPFSYTTSFSSISHFNGRKYIYVCAMDSDGIPTLNKAGEEDTDEPNGLEIKFSVQTYDCQSFINKASAVYKYFKYKPEIVGGICDIKPVTYIAEGKGWGLHRGDESNVIMGGISYPIDAKFFSKYTADYQIGQNGDNAEAILLKAGVDIYCEIGDFEMSASREALQYTSSTVSSLKSRLEDVLIDIDKRVTDDIKQCTTLWEATCCYQELLFNKFKNFSNVLAARNLEWQGQKIKLTIDANDFSMFEFRDVGNVNPKRYTVTRVNVHNKVGIILNDVARGAFSLCNRLIKDNKYKNVYLVSFNDPTNLKEFVELLGNPPIIKASSLPKPPKGSSEYVKRDDVFTYDIKRSGILTISGSNYWLPATDDVDMEEGGYYVEMSSYKIKYNGTSMEACELAEILNVMQSLKIDIPVVYGVKTKVLPRFKINTNWEEFTVYCKKEIEKYILANNLAEHRGNLNYIGQTPKITEYANLVSSSTIKPDAGTDLYNLYEKIQELNKSKPYQNIINSINQIKNKLCFQLDSVSKYDLSGDFAAMKAKYPILKFLTHTYCDSDKSTVIVNYLNKEN